MTTVAVVILNFNGAGLLRQFLPSVLEHSQGAEIIVADNGSTDDSREILRTHFPDVRLMALEKNFGFCGGYNRALASVNASYSVLLNSDVEVSKGWLSPMKALLDANPDIAAVQPKILSHRQRDRFEYAGAGGGFIDALGYPFCRGRLFDHLEPDQGQYDDERPVFWTSGACMMIRTEVFRRFGGFDELFFAHMEEIDLCWRIARSGMHLYYTGRSHVYHLGAGTLAYQHPQKTYLNFRNGLMMLYKHLGGIEVVYKLPARLLLDWLAALAFLLRGQPGSCRSVFRAHFTFARLLPQLRGRRAAIRSEHPRYPRNNIHPGLIIFAYYLGRRRRVTPQ